MIWGTSIWRLECSNRSKIRSAQKCYLCLRYEVSPMCPGWTVRWLVGAVGIEPATLGLYRWVRNWFRMDLYESYAAKLRFFKCEFRLLPSAFKPLSFLALAIFYPIRLFCLND